MKDTSRERPAKKRTMNTQKITKRVIKDALLMTTGILCASFGFKGFLMNNNFIDGGATGISLLISNTTEMPLSILLILVNAPFILMGFKILGKNFGIKTILSISGLASCVAFVDFPHVTDNEILVAIFGGIFLGAGIGFTIRGGAVIDGTEILAIYLSKKFGLTIGDIIIILNVFIFSAAIYFLSVEIALFSMLTYFAASRTLDFIVEGIDEYLAVTLISKKSEEVMDMIVKKMGRGVTVFKGERGYGSSGEMVNTKILYTVITRLEVNKFNAELEQIDPNCFVVMNSIKDTKGGMVKKRPLKH